MTKTIGALAVAAFLGTSSAMAADVGSPASYDWTGFYAGVNGSWASSNLDGLYDSGGNPGPLNPSTFEGTNWMLGGRLGYNVQMDQFVLGGELTGDFAITQHDYQVSIFGGGAPFRYLPSKVEDLASARIRAGFAIDRLLLIASGGIGYSNFRLDGSSDGGIDGGPTSLNVSNWGPVVGIGAEYAVSNNFIVNAQYSHYFINSTTDLAAAGFIDADAGDHLDIKGIDQVSVGLTLKF